MEGQSAFVTTSMGGEAYAQWVRRAIRHAMSECGTVVPLFDSSVEEPVGLLREIVADGFSEPITSRYQSVFVGGNPFVLEALSARYDTPINTILPTTGATGGLTLIYRTFLSPGDHVLVETPGFDLFADIGLACGANVDHFQRSGLDFGIDPDEIADKITPKTKLVVLSNLHNPTGMLLTEAALKEIVKVVERTNVKLVVDEVYLDYATKGVGARSAIHLSPSVISVSSLTKIYGLSSLRCGWIIAAPDVLPQIRRINDQFEFGISKLSHAVAALVFDNHGRFDDYSRAVLSASRPIMESHLNLWRSEGLATGSLPSFGCISFPKLEGVVDTMGFSAWLADKYGVIVAPGEFFGAAGHVRIGHAHAPEVLDYGLTRFYEGLTEFLATSALPAAVHG